MKHNQHTFSQRGSISVNKSRLFAFRSKTSAPPAFPRIISPAFLEASTDTSSNLSNVLSSTPIDTMVAVFFLEDVFKAVNCFVGFFIKKERLGWNKKVVQIRKIRSSLALIVVVEKKFAMVGSLFTVL